MENITTLCHGRQLHHWNEIDSDVKIDREDKNINCRCTSKPRQQWFPQNRLLLLPCTMAVLLVVFVCSAEATASRKDLACYSSVYGYNASKTIVYKGKLMPCYGNILVWSCIGRCDSFEYGDYKLPFKISHHPVCTYTGKKSRIVRLSNCHPEHPNPYIEVFDAQGCACNVCNPEYMSCENLNG